MKNKTSDDRSMGSVGELVRRQMEQEFPLLRKEQRHVFRLALNEAEALAWQTPIPLLVFPLLAYEKLKTLDKWNRRQKRLRENNNLEIALSA